MEAGTERTTWGVIFDRTTQSLKGLPDVSEVKGALVRTFTAIREEAQTWVVQTRRHRERGDFVFLEYIGPEGDLRLVLPPAVADCIDRQRDSLSSKNRRTAAKQSAAVRKAAGWVPNFGGKRGVRRAKGKGKGKGKGKAKPAAEGGS